MTPAAPPAPLVTYDVTEATIAAIAKKCAPLSAETSHGYEEVRLAIADIRETRVAIEKRRVELKTDALAYGRLVDSEAKRFTVMLLAIEEPLKLKKEEVDYEKSRLKAEKDAAERKLVEDRIRLERDAEEARLTVLREAEEARIAADRTRLDAERKELDEARRHADEAARVLREATEAAQATERARLAQVEAAQHVEREALEAERRAVAAEREQAERIEFERQATIKAEADAKVRREINELAEATRQAELAALKPDIEKVRAFVDAIKAVAMESPSVRSKKAKTVIAGAVTSLISVANIAMAEADRWT